MFYAVILSYTQRTTCDKAQVVLGELDKYEARCRSCFKLPKEINLMYIGFMNIFLLMIAYTFPQS